MKGSPCECAIWMDTGHARWLTWGGLNIWFETGFAALRTARLRLPMLWCWHALKQCNFTFDSIYFIPGPSVRKLYCWSCSTKIKLIFFFEQAERRDPLNLDGIHSQRPWTGDNEVLFRSPETRTAMKGDAPMPFVTYAHWKLWTGTKLGTLAE